MKSKTSKQIPSNKSDRNDPTPPIVEPLKEIEKANACFKANLTLKSQKLLKRDLLRCFDHRTAFYPLNHFHHPKSEHRHRLETKSVDRSPTKRPRSLSIHQKDLDRTLQYFGPWTDHHFHLQHSNRHEYFRPLKNSTRFFSPKDLNEKPTYSSISMSIEDYRKQKGYRLNISKTKSTSVSDVTSESDDRPISINQDFTPIPTTDLSLSQSKITVEHPNTTPSIPSMTRILSESYYVHNFPSITMRNGHLRPIRHPPRHPVVAQHTVPLPSLTGSSLNYLNALNAAEKANLVSPSKSSSSKLFFIQGRRKKRISFHLSHDSEVLSRSADYSAIRATGGPIIANTSRATAIVVYQFPGPATPVTSQSDIGPLS